jgi:hypothetical protein
MLLGKGRLMSGRNVVLIGDSIFDNATYVPGEPSVIEQLRELVALDGRATLLARDGSVIGDIPSQLARIPADATELVVSIGGNNALLAQGVINVAAGTVMSALGHLSAIRTEFQQGYRVMLGKVLERGLPTAVCTIYDGVPDLFPEFQTALAIFNDTITREAMAVGVEVIDLRTICNLAEDYSAVSSIEPSAIGGRKIAAAIYTWLSR